MAAFQGWELLGRGNLNLRIGQTLFPDPSILRDQTKVDILLILWQCQLSKYWNARGWNTAGALWMITPLAPWVLLLESLSCLMVHEPRDSLLRRGPPRCILVGCCHFLIGCYDDKCFWVVPRFCLMMWKSVTVSWILMDSSTLHHWRPCVASRFHPFWFMWLSMNYSKCFSFPLCR